MTTITIEHARSDDGAAIIDLLTTSALPTEGLTEHLMTAVVARNNGHVVGCAALELYDDGALLRSVAVDPVAKGKGVGSRLVAVALDLARSRGARMVYLLTTTAEAWFPRFGFERITRDEVADGVRRSAEFTSVCPSTATVMRRRLESHVSNTTAELPVACTLLPNDLNARTAELLPGLVAMSTARVATEAGYHLVFEASANMLSRIAAVIDAERQCCQFLRFQLIVEPGYGPVRLEISGPPGTKEFLDQLLRTPGIP
jgi:amino-acid N-acetyltransferase